MQIEIGIQCGMFAHITTSVAWMEALEAGVYSALSLETQGFIHCSEISAEQLLAVADHLYAGQSGLVLLLIEPQRLTSALRYEEFETSANFFPHVYGPINLDAVVRVLPFPPQPDGTFQLPDLSGSGL